MKYIADIREEETEIRSGGSEKKFSISTKQMESLNWVRVNFTSPISRKTNPAKDDILYSTIKVMMSGGLGTLLESHYTKFYLLEDKGKVSLLKNTGFTSNGTSTVIDFDIIVPSVSVV